MNSFKRGALTFDVIDQGPRNGEPVVLLHGFPEGVAAWEKVGQIHTESGYRVIIPSQRGYSPQARPNSIRAYSLPELTDDVIALLDELKISKAHLVGHDWGGAVAWSVATKAPNRLESLTVISTPHPKAFLRALYTSRQCLQSWYMLFFQLPKLPEWVIRQQNGRIGIRLLLSTDLSKSYAKSYVQAFIKDPSMLNGALNWYRALRYIPSKSTQLRPINVPTLYIWGTKDAATSKAAASLTKNWVRAPYAFIKLEGATHWLPQQQPKALAAMITEHIVAHEHGN